MKTRRVTASLTPLPNETPVEAKRRHAALRRQDKCLDRAETAAYRASVVAEERA